MTRYGFSYKALPSGSKPFGADDEDDETQEAVPGGESPPGPPSGGQDGDELPPADPSDELPPAPDPPEPSSPPDGSTTGEEGAGAVQPEQAPPVPDDDSRPWAGDRYDEGDETTPEAALYGYTGAGGEQAWLDKDVDGTLTGWVRDETGQVWRYTDVDAWAADVDGAQMTRTHSRADGDEPQQPDGAPPEEHGEQDLMFANT
ncbi:hypothetical protein ACFCZR_24670 [Streptomyces rubiginosohelvolus]|uniref:hypothetical protein n=1 Tax=Streptomyces rubiginosohelvolus TaxID=67362 RepID=UPI0035D85808